jgi:cell division protease FtsH
VVIKVEKPTDGRMLTALLSWAPLLILVGLWFVFFRQMQAGGTKAMSFGKSKAKLLTPEQKKITFEDVAGVPEAKEELEEIIDFLKDPKKFQRLGGKIPKGVLLMGSPGTGKTLLARAVAGEADVPFFSISGSDFVEMFVGVGASRVRDLFEQGKKSAPCIIFIDEIDAVGRHRGAGLGGGHDEREQTLNQLLVEMDGFEANDGVILIAATNRPDVLDPALLRPGRFDRRIVVNPPDVKGREGILQVHTAEIPLASDVELPLVARSTPGFSGADLANLVNEAALRAARFNKMKVDMADFEFAKDKVMMGSERRSLAMSEEEKRTTAYHEAGHALVAVLVPEADPLHKVTIIPRGMALGLTQQLPLEDRYTYSRGYLDANLRVLMGGRIAEEIVFGEDSMTTGAGNDLERATELARKMVCEWGMSARMGPLTFGKREESIFLGKEFARHQDYSESTAVAIDDEIRRFVTAAYDDARRILEDHREALEAITAGLLEHEVLDGDKIYALIAEHSDVDVEAIRRSKQRHHQEVSETA